MPSYKPVGELVNVTPEHPFEEIRDREAVWSLTMLGMWRLVEKQLQLSHCSC